MGLVDELHEAALKVEAFYGHSVAARVMREAAKELQRLQSEEAPVEDVVILGEEE